MLFLIQILTAESLKMIRTSQIPRTQRWTRSPGPSELRVRQSHPPGLHQGGECVMEQQASAVSCWNFRILQLDQDNRCSNEEMHWADWVQVESSKQFTNTIQEKPKSRDEYGNSCDGSESGWMWVIVHWVSAKSDQGCHQSVATVVRGQAAKPHCQHNSLQLCVEEIPRWVAATHSLCFFLVFIFLFLDFCPTLWNSYRITQLGVLTWTQIALGSKVSSINESRGMLSFGEADKGVHTGTKSTKVQCAFTLCYLQVFTKCILKSWSASKQSSRCLVILHVAKITNLSSEAERRQAH